MSRLFKEALTLDNLHYFYSKCNIVKCNYTILWRKISKKNKLFNYIKTNTANLCCNTPKYLSNTIILITKQAPRQSKRGAFIIYF